MKRYSPPAIRLKVVMPSMRLRAGSAGMVNRPCVGSSSCRPTIGSRSEPRSTKLPPLIHSCCMNSIVSKARALMKMK